MGTARLIRYADDAVLLFANERDARRVLAVLPMRMARFGLTLHPEKTRLIEFQRPNRRSPADRSGPGTFDLLGFTHFWSVSRSGKWLVARKTAMGQHFSCTCSDCSTTWGTIACGCCSGLIAMLRLHGTGWATLVGEPGWVDRSLGADVLATPRIVGSEIKFVCPFCGPARWDEPNTEGRSCSE